MNPNEVRSLLEASGSTLGRFSGPELFWSQNVDLTNPVVVAPTRPLPLNRPLESIMVRLRGRVAVTVANYTAVNPEGFANLLQLFTLFGTHKDFGNLTTIKMSGATAYVWQRLFQINGSETLTGSTGSTQTRAADPGRPYTSTFAGTTAGSPYDFDIVWHIPLTPVMGEGQDIKRQSTNFLYQPLHWADTLQAQLNFADKSGLGDPTGATVAFTAFGSGAGNPLLEIHLNYALLGQFANRMRSGVVLRSENVLSGFTSSATFTQLQLLQKQITTNVMIKSGVAQTAGLTTGVSGFASLSDLQLDKTQIIVDNKPVRWNQSNLVSKAYYERMFNTIHPTGYFLQSFVDGQGALLAYRGDGLQGGSQFALFSDVTGVANARYSVVQEMVFGGPFPALR